MNYLKEFFITIHRSITDPQFYGEVQSFKKVKVFSFILALFVFTSIIESSFHFGRLLNKDFGLPKYLAIALSDVSIYSDKLVNKREKKFVVDPITMNEITKLLSDFKSKEDLQIPDSLILINGKDDSVPSSKSSVLLSFNRTSVLFKQKNGAYGEIPYSILFKHLTIPKDNGIQFTEQSIMAYFYKHFIGLFLNIFLSHFFLFAFQYFSSVIFLALAAFIFKRSIVNRLISMFKLSLYASSVIAIEGMITSAAGYSSIFTWYAAIFISIYAMFKGLNLIERHKLESGKQINGNFR